MCHCKGYGFQAVYSREVLPYMHMGYIDMCAVKGLVLKQFTLGRSFHILWSIFVLYMLL